MWIDLDLLYFIWETSYQYFGCFIFIWVIWHDPTYWCTHPPTQPYTHLYVGESPQISNVQTELNYLNSFKVYWIFTDLMDAPLGVGVDGWVVVRVCQRVWENECPTHVCTHTYTHACACIHKQWCHNGNHQEKPIAMGAAICMKLSCLYMCVSVCACMCTCV